MADSTPLLSNGFTEEDDNDDAMLPPSPLPQQLQGGPSPASTPTPTPTPSPSPSPSPPPSPSPSPAPATPPQSPTSQAESVHTASPTPPQTTPAVSAPFDPTQATAAAPQHHEHTDNPLADAHPAAPPSPLIAKSLPNSIDSSSLLGDDSTRSQVRFADHVDLDNGSAANVGADVDADAAGGRGVGVGQGAGAGARLGASEADTPLLSAMETEQGMYGSGTSGRYRASSYYNDSKQLDSFDFAPYDSHVNTQYRRSKTMSYFRVVECKRWGMTLAIGAGTALVAVLITMAARALTTMKLSNTYSLLDKERTGHATFGLGALYFVALSLLFAFIAALPAVFVSPVAAGSGISEIKCLLNGVKVPKAVRITTLLCKVFGVCFAVASGLPVGKEGPMIHSGAILGAGLSQGKSTTMRFNTGWSKFQEFRNDVEKRDFVVCGSAAGVAAAFGAPIGGVLFALEEGASFWFAQLTWRTYFCAMISSYVLDIFLSGINPDTEWGKLSSPGMFSFGSFDATGQNERTYSIYEVPFFILIGVAGGLMGAVFNDMNRRLTLWRGRRVTTKLRRLGEVVLIATLFAAARFLLPLVYQDCTDLPPTSQNQNAAELVQLYCPDGQYNPLASLFLVSSETAILQLFHAEGLHSFAIFTLVIFFLVFAAFTCWTYGVAVPSGLFVPSLVAGAAFGKLVGILLNLAMPNAVVGSGTYALIGAAAFLGGMARMTISLAVILLECTGDYQYGLPLMVTLLAARWTGNVFNEGLYDIHIELKHWPLLEQDPTTRIYMLDVRHVMTHDPVTVPLFARVRDVVRILREHSHDGFPVTYPHQWLKALPRMGDCCGLINRKHLTVLLSRRVCTPEPDWEGLLQTVAPGATPSVVPTDVRCVLEYKDFEGTFPRYPKIDDIDIPEEDMDMYLDLRPYVNHVPHVVKEKAPATQAYNLFRTLGMRHLVVVDDCHDVVGVITRADLTGHRISHVARKVRSGRSAGVRASFRQSFRFLI